MYPILRGHLAQSACRRCIHASSERQAEYRIGHADATDKLIKAAPNC